MPADSRTSLPRMARTYGFTPTLFLVLVLPSGGPAWARDEVVTPNSVALWVGFQFF